MGEHHGEGIEVHHEKRIMVLNMGGEEFGFAGLGSWEKTMLRRKR